MRNNFWSRFAILLLATVCAANARGQFEEIVMERTETRGSGTKNDPLITEIWEDFDVGGGIDTSPI